VSVTLLAVFLGAVSEIELMADRIEDFLMNKYFAKAKVDKRLEFKAEEVAKLDYHIRQHQP
jgi:hypothetical protein